jgi:beta-lactamase regulating signal transducer with metallopeptidase domain
MSQFILSLFFGGTTIAAFYRRISMERDLKTESIKKGHKTYLFEPLSLPFCIIVMFITLLIIDSGLRISAVLVDWGLLFLYISIYYSVLLLILPLLRRIISAWACATLWIIPNGLYFTTQAFKYYIAYPRLFITIPRQWLSTFIWIWAIGFVSVVLWQLISHFIYRRLLLKNAEEFTDNTILSLWYNEVKWHGVKHKIPIMISKTISTPITIGCFDRTMRLVLPKQNYAEEDFKLIFRHELRHILRADTRTKMFIGLSTAICWFNPLSWVARRKASDDLELSCDEAVLAGTDEITRRQYAELLLKNAGNSRGYTTCLSASAASLRYRLRNIVKPTKRFSGGIVVGIAIIALLMTVGTVAVADNSTTVQAAIFDKAPTGITINYIDAYKWGENQNHYLNVYGWNEELLTRYIASLRVKQLYSGNYTYIYDDVGLAVNYREVIDGKVTSIIRFQITDKLLFVKIPYNNNENITFLLEDEIDWSYFNTLLDLYDENPDSSLLLPD